MFFYNQSTQTATEIKNYNDINPSFEAWFEKSNNLNENGIKSLYNKKINELKKIYDKMKKGTKKEELKNQISKLKKERNTKVKEAKKADKQIIAFKKLRSAFKSCCEAIDLANTEVDGLEILNIDKSFLQEYEKILNAREENNIKGADYSASNLEKKTKELINKTKKILENSRKGKKSSNYIKSSEVWYRKLLSGIGIKKEKNARESKSAKYSLTGTNDFSRWMEKHIKDNAKLADIIIPSSHDAGSYSIVPLSGTDIFAKAAQTQTVNFRGQLRAGIRYFDLRIVLENGIPVMYHDIVKGAPVSEGIRQLLKFIKSHPKEVVIVEISHTSDECLKKFYKLPIVKELEKYNFNVGHKKVGNLTVGEIRKSGKNLIMFNEATTKYIRDVYNEEIRQSRDDKEILDNELKNLVNNWVDNKTLRILHKITPTHCATIKDFFSEGKTWKPLWNAAKKSKDNYKYLLNSKEFREFANVVSYDDALGSAWFANELIKLNQERMKKIN